MIFLESLLLFYLSLDIFVKLSPESTARMLIFSLRSSSRSASRRAKVSGNFAVEKYQLMDSGICYNIQFFCKECKMWAKVSAEYNNEIGYESLLADFNR